MNTLGLTRRCAHKYRNLLVEAFDELKQTSPVNPGEQSFDRR